MRVEWRRSETLKHEENDFVASTKRLLASPKQNCCDVNFNRVIPQDGAERRNQEEERKKYHNKLAEAIQNIQFGPSLRQA